MILSMRGFIRPDEESSRRRLGVVDDRDFFNGLFRSFDDFFEFSNDIAFIDDFVAVRAFITGDIPDDYETCAEVGDIGRRSGDCGDIAIETFHFCRSFRVAKSLSHRVASGKYEVIR